VKIEMPLKPGVAEVSMEFKLGNARSRVHAGGWKSARMPLQYAEKINAAR
jgi:hypothetical protein